MADKIYIRGGLAADRPTLAPREPSIDTDTKQVWIGTSSGNEMIHAPYDKTSSFRANANVVQSFSAGVATKALYQAEVYDNLSEYASSRFTASKAGIYMIQGGLQFDTVTASTHISFLAYVNGSVQSVLYDTFSGGGFMAPNGVAIIKLNANDYVEIYVSMSNTTATLITYTPSYFSAVRVA